MLNFQSLRKTALKEKNMLSEKKNNTLEKKIIAINAFQSDRKKVLKNTIQEKKQTIDE